MTDRSVVFDVDGEPVRLCGVPEGAVWTPEAKAALVELVRAAREQYTAEKAGD